MIHTHTLADPDTLIAIKHGALGDRSCASFVIHHQLGD